MSSQTPNYDPLTQIAILSLANLVAFIGLVMIVAGRRAAGRVTGWILRFLFALLLLYLAFVWLLHRLGLK